MIKKWLDKVDRVDKEPTDIYALRLHSSERIYPYDNKFFTEFIETLTPHDFIYYPELHSLYTAIAELHNIKEENLFIGNGSDICIRSIFDCLEIGTVAITTDPNFPMYDVYAQLNGVTLLKEKYNEDLTINLGRFLLPDIDVVIISNPCSPVGNMFTYEALEGIAKTGKLLIIDEAYIDYTNNPPNTIKLMQQYDNVIITRSFSKGLGAAGCRVGYAIANKKLIDTISKFRSIYEVSGPSAKFAEFLLSRYNYVKNYCNETRLLRPKIIEFFKDRNYDVVCTEGNWIHVQEDTELLKHMNQHALIRANTTLPHREGKWIRLTIGPNLLDLDFIKNIPWRE